MNAHRDSKAYLILILPLALLIIAIVNHLFIGSQRVLSLCSVSVLTTLPSIAITIKKRHHLSTQPLVYISVIAWLLSAHIYTKAYFI